MSLFKRLLFVVICLLFGHSTSAQKIEFQELNFNSKPNPSLIKMDTSHNKIVVASALDQFVNLQIYDLGNSSKTREINLPLKLSFNEKIADMVILRGVWPGIVLKTYTPDKIFIKSIKMEGPGLISKPEVLLEFQNKRQDLLINEDNPRKAVNNQVHFENSPNRKYISVVNKQSLTCDIESNGLEIHNFNDSLKLKGKFNASNCAFKDLHIFDNGQIAITKNEFGRIVFELYSAFFARKIYTYAFPEIIGRKVGDITPSKDTFDQQVQFYFDDRNNRVYGFIKGFVNNNYITHVGLYIYDLEKQQQVETRETPGAIKELVRYNLAYRDFFKGYGFEYPMHLSLKYIKKRGDGTYEVVGDYMSYGRMPLGTNFAGHAQSEATYIIHLNKDGSLINTKILLHKQSIISYPSDSAEVTSYEVSHDRVDYRVGQLYLYNSDLNYVIHNEDRKSFYTPDRLYRFVYYGRDQSIAGVHFTPNVKTKIREKALNDYTLLPMQSTLAISSDKMLCFAMRKKKVKLLALSLAKP